MEPGTRGSVSWSKGEDALGVLGFEVKDGSFVLDYRYRRNSSEEWEEVRYPVRLSRTPCNFGGSRPWFACPVRREHDRADREHARRTILELRTLFRRV